MTLDPDEEAARIEAEKKAARNEYKRCRMKFNRTFDSSLVAVFSVCVCACAQPGTCVGIIQLKKTWSWAGQTCPDVVLKKAAEGSYSALDFTPNPIS